VLTGLASLQGPQAGTTAFAISRAPFGPRGNKLPSFFNWITQVGFEILGITLIVFAGILLAAKAGFAAGTAAKVIFIILAVAIQAVLPLLGHAAVLRVLKWLAIPFVVLFAVMAALATSKVNLHVPAHGASWGALTIFLALVISAGGLGWTEDANDYSRYLPPSTDKKRIVAAVALGTAIPSALLEILGAAVATGVPSATSVNGLISASRLVRRALSDLRHLPAVRDQHPGPVLIRRDAAEPGAPAEAAALRGHRHARLRRSCRVCRVLRGLLPAADRLRPVHHRVARPLVRDLPGRQLPAQEPL
jgi:hypothetical protein